VRPVNPRYTQHPDVRQNAPNKGAYDGKIRSFKSVSYPDSKGGNNGLTIFTVTYASLPEQARRLIKRIRQRERIGRSWKRGRYRNDRMSPAYGNLTNHLPAAGVYQEYNYEDRSMERGETRVPRLIHDERHDNFYVTVTHYRAYQATESILRPASGGQEMEEVEVTEVRNPFYRVKDIPFEKQRARGAERELKRRSVAELAGLDGPRAPDRGGEAWDSPDLIKF
jgi:hypothetical protein